ncbi:TPA: hypothetical protein ACNABU_005410 [Citrobacter amalonaticus]
MANSWLRLWHDMPNDPKWRTIARKSNQRISDVIAVYLHVLVNASESGETTCNAGETQGNKEEQQSNKPERGKVKDLCADDIASALDLETEQVEQILSAMQGKVLDGDYVTGWDKRQPLREDSSTARVKAFRERKRQEKQLAEAGGNGKGTTCNAGETQGNAPDTDTDTDTEKELKNKNTMSDSDRTGDVPTSSEKSPAQENSDSESGEESDRDEPSGDAGQVDLVDTAFEEIFWGAGLRKDAKVKARSAFRTKYRDWKKTTRGSPAEFAGILAEDIRLRVQAGQFGVDRLLPTSYLNGERWNDEKPTLPDAQSAHSDHGPQTRESWATQSSDGSAEVFVNYAALERAKRGSYRQ